MKAVKIARMSQRLFRQCSSIFVSLIQDRNPIQISTEGIDLDEETVFCIAMIRTYYRCNLISNPKTKSYKIHLQMHFLIQTAGMRAVGVSEQQGHKDTTHFQWC